MLRRPPPDPAPEQPRYQAYPVQLSEIWLARASIVRRPARKGDPDETSVTTGQTLRHESPGDPPECSVTVRIRVRIQDTELFDVKLTLRGRLAIAPGTASGQVRFFIRQQAFYVIWPFARAHFDSIAKMAGVQLPPLPILAVPGASRVLPRA